MPAQFLLMLMRLVLMLQVLHVWFGAAGHTTVKLSSVTNFALD